MWAPIYLERVRAPLTFGAAAAFSITRVQHAILRACFFRERSAAYCYKGLRRNISNSRARDIADSVQRR
jgi:hypothetical protein